MLLVFFCQLLKSVSAAIYELHFSPKLIQNIFNGKSIEMLIFAEHYFVWMRLFVFPALALGVRINVVNQVDPSEVLLAVFGEHVVKYLHDALEVLNIHLIFHQQD